LSTWTLIVPPRESACSTRSAFAGSCENRYTRALVSKKLPGIRLIPVELKVDGEAAAESTQAL